MRPRGTAVRFELVDQIVVQETAPATPRAVLAWERFMREVEHVAVFGVDASRQKKSRAGSQCPARRLGLFKHCLSCGRRRLRLDGIGATVSRNVLWDALRLANVVRDVRPFALVGRPSRGLGKGYRGERYDSGDCRKRLDEHGHHSVYSCLSAGHSGSGVRGGNVVCDDCHDVLVLLVGFLCVQKLVRGVCCSDPP